MGCGFSFVCKTCRRVFHLGYGAYGTWFVYPKSIEHFEQFAGERPKHAKLQRNQNIRTCLLEHEKHNFEYLYHGVETLSEITADSNEYQEIDMPGD
jgi:hypothetical protein